MLFRSNGVKKAMGQNISLARHPKFRFISYRNSIFLIPLPDSPYAKFSLKVTLNVSLLSNIKGCDWRSLESTEIKNFTEINENQRKSMKTDIYCHSLQIFVMLLSACRNYCEQKLRTSSSFRSHLI